MLLVATSAALIVFLAHSNERDLGLGARNTLHAVMLVNGPVYYGFLDRSTKDAIVLRDIFYVQVSTDTGNNNRINRLVRRSETDWHGPEQMSIPIDKIMFVEVVGPNSNVAKLVNDARTRVKLQ
ncbi:MAG: hypothetical protein ACXWCY_31890 [Burkholderiales bacterium]